MDSENISDMPMDEDVPEEDAPLGDDKTTGDDDDDDTNNVDHDPMEDKDDF